MAVCSFSGKQIPVGRGVHVFMRDGTSLWFYDRKCEQAYLNKRSAAKLKWTEKGKLVSSDRKMKTSAKTAKAAAAKSESKPVVAAKAPAKA